MSNRKKLRGIQLNHIKAQIELITSNHLTHMQKDISHLCQKIEKLDQRLWYVLGILIAGTLLPTLISLLK